ncbi:hypothetical protein OIU77_003578 [Salix suchowensis]|uniref:Homeobox domain-containing protein n=1 Tax=Salix suchowensis TaxID=1278906 RepID=A0ABQ9B382_9ROSI|nr:hypothetical protein OIU77_003578 [Salix suchowensis]
MEPQQQQQHQQQPDEDNNGGAKGSFLCRQTSTRWTPTADQIRILKELYYIKGVRSPNGAEIQQISARLRKYGKIEGKNVFYWFQNHKARFSSSSANTGAVTVGQRDIHGYGSVTMQEKTFWDCPVPAGGSNIGAGGGSMMSNTNYGSGISCTVFDQDQEADAEIETLPLFPMHGEEHINGSFNINNINQDFYYSSCYGGSDNDYCNDSTSLELSLYTYNGGQPQDY